MTLLAIIGGSGFAELPSLDIQDRQPIRTPYGDTSALVARGRLNGTELLFLPRHGIGHHLPPHRINYRANLWALRSAGAGAIVGLASVGGIGERFGPNVLAVPDQIVDYTYGRDHTIHDGEDREAAPVSLDHVDMTEPYCESLRQALLGAGTRAGEPLVPGGTYGATQGPRLETPAEIRRCERDGCDLVGMTGMPEAALAREFGLCYASLAFVVNWAAGKGDGQPITMDGIRENLTVCSERVLRVLQALAADPEFAAPPPAAD